jgi:putative transposase
MAAWICGATRKSVATGTRQVAQPGVMKEIRGLIVKMAQESSGWGYRRIQGAPMDLGHRVAKSTVAKVLKEHGTKPAPDRLTSWKIFPKARRGAVAGQGCLRQTPVATWR